MTSAQTRLRVTIWNEYRQEREEEETARTYPQGIHGALAAELGRDASLEIRTATLDEPEHGLPPAVLDATDVLLWWGHRAHREVSAACVDRIEARVRAGMGFVALHSAHFAEPFIRLMGTSCKLGHWAENGRRETLWVVAPDHPVAQGLAPSFSLPQTEMYCEPFDVPPPDELLLVSAFEGGEAFRSGCVWHRGRGRVVYLRPGHETYRIYHDPHMLRLLANTVHWLGSPSSPPSS